MPDERVGPMDPPAHRPVVEPAASMAIDMPAARQQCVDEAYAIALQSRPDAHTYAWSVPSVELIPLAVGPHPVPIYRVTVHLERPYRLFVRGGKRIFTFQLDPASGRFVGLQDSGWVE